jgi:thiol-disulfide isomerase/thioredoxin
MQGADSTTKTWHASVMFRSFGKARARPTGALVIIMASLGCKDESTSGIYRVPERTEVELQQALREVCQAAVAKKTPVLLEFSAPWCKDCRRLAEMKQLPELAGPLEAVPHLAINVGRFSRHEALLEAFTIKAIARWELLAPANCDETNGVEPWRWGRVASRTLEPLTGQPVDAAELGRWLSSRGSIPAAGP